LRIAKNIQEIVGSLKRNDARMRRIISSKYGMRRRERVRQIIHGVTKRIVQDAKANKRDSLRGNQRNPQPPSRGKRQVLQSANELMALPRGEAAGRAQGRVGRSTGHNTVEEGYERDHDGLREMRGETPIAGDLEHHRQLWCDTCERWMDTDPVAVFNISRRGRVRFARSSTKDEATEAAKGDAERDGSS